MLSGAALYLLFAFIPAFDGVSPALGAFFDAILPLFMFLVLFVTFCKVDFRKLVPVKWNYCVSLFQVAFVWILVGAILFFRLKGNELTFCRVGPDLHYRALCRGSTRSDRQTRRTTGGNHHLWLSLQFPLCNPNPSLLPAHRAVVSPRLLSCRLPPHPLSGVYRLGLADGIGLLREAFQASPRLPPMGDQCQGPEFLSLGRAVDDRLGSNGQEYRPCSYHFALSPRHRFLGASSSASFNLPWAVLWAVSLTGPSRRSGLGQKNTGFAIWIAFMYLTPLASVGPGCYILWQNTINSIEIWKKRKTGQLKNRLSARNDILRGPNASG